jgi:hypothetical protein
MDLAGAVADIGNLPLQGIDYLVNQIRGTDQNYISTDRPFGGSAQLIDAATRLGLSQQPTGSAPETIGRVMAGLINPMAGARAVGRVGDITTEQANRAADALVRQITGNPQATAPQVLQETSMPFMQAVAPKAPSLEKIYHGTSPQAAKQIEKAGFDITKSADGSVWFTNNPDIGEVSATGKGAVVERLADINKLKLGGWEETDKFSTNELIQKGFDGLRLVDGDTVTYQIFNPEKLKSPVSDKTFTGLLEPKTSVSSIPARFYNDSFLLDVLSPIGIDDYEIISGIREVSKGAFDKKYLDSLSFEKFDKRTKDLATQVQESKENIPMVVAVDSKGAYIIEGGHRFDALMAQDTKSIPAIVVADKSDPPSKILLKGLLEPETPKSKMPSFASLRPETTDDVDKIYDYLEKQAKKSGFRAESGASNVSNSRYLTIEKDLGNDEISTIEVRISAHGDRHPFTYATDGKISIDPETDGVNLKTALLKLKEKGYDLIK